ncbi:CIA30 family protein [Rhodopseudomonas sp. WA056]|uniref:CIA30 family protein n=1 Tax=Rhodopseudomonas sp. WA056 TaxID=2269367 RepID=UPI0013DFD2A3|nr:CIA30 family protein [Rhodopseudomonas sp. WA056]NEW87592.1 CIA30 family protein [Rhodopseudomonas sp. WA056]
MQHELWPAAGQRHWRVITDTVMGGVSQGTVELAEIEGRTAARMRGAVSTENNGGFIQIAMDLSPDGGAFDAGGFEGIAAELFGNDQAYGLHLRTTDLLRPQQSYRHPFEAPPRWQGPEFPFAALMPHRTDMPFDPRRLRRVGLVAIGREFDADLSVARLWLY